MSHNVVLRLLYQRLSHTEFLQQIGLPLDFATSRRFSTEGDPFPCTESFVSGGYEMHRQYQETSRNICTQPNTMRQLVIGPQELLYPFTRLETMEVISLRDWTWKKNYDVLICRIGEKTPIRLVTHRDVVWERDGKWRVTALEVNALLCHGLCVLALHTDDSVKQYLLVENPSQDSPIEFSRT